MTIHAADLRIQALVFALVSAAFTAVYVTQPVLPILQAEFAIDAASGSVYIRRPRRLLPTSPTNFDSHLASPPATSMRR